MINYTFDYKQDIRVVGWVTFHVCAKIMQTCELEALGAHSKAAVAEHLTLFTKSMEGKFEELQGKYDLLVAAQK